MFCLYSSSSSSTTDCWLLIVIYDCVSMNNKTIIIVLYANDDVGLCQPALWIYCSGHSLHPMY